MEINVPGLNWDKSCLEEFKKRPNWTYVELNCASGLEQASREAGAGKYPDSNKAYVHDIRAILDIGLAKGPYDMIFVDPGVFVRADFINLLLVAESADIIATHDTDVLTQCYGWNKIQIPNTYEKINLNLGGLGVWFFIKKTKTQLINKLTTYASLKDVTLVAMEFRTEGDHVERSAAAHVS